MQVGTLRKMKKVESVRNPYIIIIVCLQPYLSTNKPIGIRSKPQIRYGAVTNMPVA